MADEEVDVHHNNAHNSVLNLHEAAETSPVDVIQLAAACRQPTINKLQTDLTRVKPLLEKLGGARVSEMVERAEPMTPTTTMAWFTSSPGPHGSGGASISTSSAQAPVVLGGDTVHSNVSHIRMPHGLLSSLLVMAVSPLDTTAEGEPPRASDTFCANYAHDEMNRTPLHEMSFPANDTKCPWHPSHHSSDVTPAVCARCKAVSKHSVTAIFNYTSLQHRCIHPMWGSEHATHGLRSHGLVNPNDIDFVDAAGSSSSSSSAKETPDMLCCSALHFVCTSCLVSCWIERASSLLNITARDQEPCNTPSFASSSLPCPVEGCECVFGMNKFWRTIYAPDVYRSAYEQYATLQKLHDLQWFYFIWYPITLMTTLNWHRVRNHPDSLVWCPNGVSPLGECASKVAHAEWRWSHAASGSERVLRFGLARDVRQLRACGNENNEERIRRSVNLSCQSLMMWVQESCRILLIDHATGLPLPVGEFDWESSVHVRLDELPCVTPPSYARLCESTCTGADFIPFPDSVHFPNGTLPARLFRVVHWLAQCPCPKCGFHESVPSLCLSAEQSSNESNTKTCPSCRIEWCQRCRRHVVLTASEEASGSLSAKWRAFLKPTACQCDEDGSIRRNDSFIVQYLDRVSAFFPNDQRSVFTTALEEVTSFMTT